MSKNVNDLPFPEIEVTDNNTFLTLFEGEVTKENIRNIVLNNIQHLKDGEGNPLDAFVKAKALSEYLNVALSELKDIAMEEAMKYSKDDNTMYGIKFEETTSPMRFDYSNNPDWVKLQKNIDELRSKQKEIEEQMKTAFRTGSHSTMVDNDTGEVLPPPKVKSGGERTLKVSIKNR